MPLILPEPRSLITGQRGLTNWWPLDAASRMGTVTIPRGYGSIYATLTTIREIDGPPYATTGGASGQTVGTSLIALSAAPHAFGGATTTPYSISFWAYLNSFTAFDSSTLGRFVCWGSSANSDEVVIMCGAAGTGSIEFKTVEAGTNTIQQTTAASLFATGVWNHFCGTFDGTVQKLYLNGASVALSNGGNSTSTASTWSLGCRLSNTRTINGNMADVRFYKGVALTAEEAAEIYLSAFIPDVEMSALFAAAAATTLVTGWQSFVENPPRRRRVIDEPQAIALTPATLPVPISGIGWFAPDEPPPHRRRVTDDPAWAAQVITQQVTAPPTGWWSQEDQRAARRTRFDDAAWAVAPIAQVPTGGFLQAADLPQRKVRRAQDEAAWATLPLSLQAPNGWFGQAADDPPRRARRAQDDMAFVPPRFAPPTAAWLASPDDISRRVRRAFDEPGLVLFPFATPTVAWLAQPDDMSRRVRRASDDNAFVPLPFSIPTVVWVPQPDDPSRRVRRASDDGAFVPLRFATPTIAWLPQPDVAARRASRRDDLTWVPQLFAPVSTIAGMAWYAPRDSYRQRPVPESPPTFVLTSTTLPAGISGMAWFAPWELPYRRSLTWPFADSVWVPFVPAVPIPPPPFPSRFKTIAVDCAYGSDGLARSIVRPVAPVVNVGDAAVLFVTVSPWVPLDFGFALVVGKPDGTSVTLSPPDVWVGASSVSTWVGTFEPGVFLVARLFPTTIDQAGGYTVQVTQGLSFGPVGRFTIFR